MAILKANPTDVLVSHEHSLPASWLTTRVSPSHGIWKTQPTRNILLEFGLYVIVFHLKKESCTLHSHISQYSLGVALITPSFSVQPY